MLGRSAISTEPICVVPALFFPQVQFHVRDASSTQYIPLDHSAGDTGPTAQGTPR